MIEWTYSYSVCRLSTITSLEMFVFFHLFRRFGNKDVYAEMLSLCNQCNALFWQVGTLVLRDVG